MSPPTPDQAALLEAIVDTLVPADESGPGGSQAGVDTYIASVIAGNDAMRAMYEPSLAALDSFARESEGAPFAQLDLEGRTRVLQGLESGEAQGSFVPDAATFFAIMHHNMLEGMFGDRQYGGNVDFAGWKLIGYRGVKLIQTAADQSIDGAPERPMMGREEAIEAAGEPERAGGESAPAAAR